MLCVRVNINFKRVIYHIYVYINILKYINWMRCPTFLDFLYLSLCLWSYTYRVEPAKPTPGRGDSELGNDWHDMTWYDMLIFSFVGIPLYIPCKSMITQAKMVTETNPTGQKIPIPAGLLWTFHAHNAGVTFFRPGFDVEFRRRFTKMNWGITIRLLR